MKEKNKMKSGFTLIELLVVITILAILAGAALPYVQSYVEESRIAKAKTDLDEISRALAVYETREGEYPDSNVKLLAGRYLNKAPIDPWGNEYKVDNLSGTCYSYGPDRGAAGGDDIIISYQPPLALTQVKWLDKNNTGLPDNDNDNAGDEIQMIFSRKLSASINALEIGNELDNWFQLDTNGPLTAGGLVDPSTVFSTTSVVIVATKVVVLKVSTAASAFISGVASLEVGTPTSFTASSGLQDQAAPTANFSIKGQKVVILPQ